MKLEDLFERAVVAQLDLPAPEVFSSGTSVRDTVARMREGLRNVALIENEGRVIGVFTEVDYAHKVLGRDVAEDTAIDDFMTGKPTTVRRDTTLSRCFELMSEGNFRQLPVVDEDGKPSGVVTVRHLVQFLADRYPSEILAMAPNVHQITEVDGG